MSATSNSPEKDVPRLIPSTRKVSEQSGTLSAEILRKIGLSREPGPDQALAFRIWLALKQVYTQAIDSERRTSLLQRDLAALREELLRVTAENRHLKQSSVNRQDDFQSMKKLEFLWTDKNLKQAQQIQLLEEKNRRIEAFLIKTKAAFQARFQWLKNYQERLRTYALHLNQEKLSLRRLAQQVSTEFEKSLRSHPYQPLIEEVEIETLTTLRQIQGLSATSRKRASLEANLQRLEERKTLLQSGIAFSNQILNEKAKSVIVLIQNENLSQTPPAPPIPPRPTA